MHDRSLSRSPWTCFLPASSSTPLLILGEPAPKVLPLLEDHRVLANRDAGPIGAIVRLPGGPGTESEEFAAALNRLAVDGSLLWFWRRRRPRFPPIQPSGSPSSLCARTYEVHGSALWPEGGDRAKPISKTYQIDLASDWVYACLRPLPLPHLRLTVAGGLGDRHPGWLGAVLAHVDGRAGARTAQGPISRIDATQTDVAVVQLRAGGETKWALKAGLTERASTRIDAHRVGLEALSSRPLPPLVRAGLPAVLASGRLGTREYVLEEWKPGQPAVRWMFRPRQRGCEEVLDRAVEWVTALHRATRSQPDGSLDHGDVVRTTTIRLSEWAGRRDAEFADRLAAYVDRRLAELVRWAVYGHGDYWLANVLVDPERRAVTGVLDWDRADPCAPPLEDVLSLLCLRKGLLTRWDPGRRLAAVLQGDVGERDRSRLRDYIVALDLHPRAVGCLAALYWIRFLAGRTEKLDEDRRLYARMYGSVRRILASDLEQALDRVGDRLLG